MGIYVRQFDPWSEKKINCGGIVRKVNPEYRFVCIAEIRNGKEQQPRQKKVGWLRD